VSKREAKRRRALELEVGMAIELLRDENSASARLTVSVRFGRHMVSYRVLLRMCNSSRSPPNGDEHYLQLGANLSLLSYLNYIHERGAFGCPRACVQGD
jgi:hypothetical protein